MHFWMRDRDGEWAVFLLQDQELDLSAMPWPEAPVKTGGEARRGEVRLGPGSALLHSSGVRGPGQPTYVLLSAPEANLYLNGLPLLCGLQVLEDRDEVRVPGLEPAYFSTEALARVEVMDSGSGKVSCPRCSLEIADGTSAVRCPACGIWHHSSEEYPCWGYGPSCTLCPQPTDMEVGFRWTPAEL